MPDVLHSLLAAVQHVLNTADFLKQGLPYAAPCGMKPDLLIAQAQLDISMMKLGV